MCTQGLNEEYNRIGAEVFNAFQGFQLTAQFDQIFKVTKQNKAATTMSIWSKYELTIFTFQHLSKFR